MPGKFKVAMIGAGDRARAAIYPALASLEDVELVAICDIDEERLNDAADMYGVDERSRYGRFEHDYQNMVREVEPDAVYAIGQPHTFYDIWMWCLEQGMNLYVEKPLGLTIHQARSLATVAEQHRCITQVSFQRRMTPMVVHLRDKCLERGPITHAVCRFYKNEMHPRYDARDHMMDDTVHSIDTLRWICGGEVERVESYTRRVGVSDTNFISAALYFDNGSVGYLINSWSSGRRIFAVEMHAPGICAEAEHEGKGRLYADGDTVGVEYDTTEVAGSSKYHAYTGVGALCRQFIDACRNSSEADCCFQDAVKTMEVAEIILAQSLLAGR